MSEIKRVSGSLVICDGKFNLNELVLIGKEKILGEVVKVKENESYIQVYEETYGLSPGEKIKGTGRTFSIELGPGLLGNSFDGIGRSLKLREEFLRRGAKLLTLDKKKKWWFEPLTNVGSKVKEGKLLGVVYEGKVEHKIFSPVNGIVAKIEAKEYTVDDTVAIIKDGEKEHKIKLRREHPIYQSMKFKKRIGMEKMAVTGQRMLDTFFPAMQGSAIAIPGPFGGGKTVLIQHFTKFTKPDVVVFVGCGERGNEIIQLIEGLKSVGKEYLNRTVFIANTSNMPVAARISGIFTGACISEYYRNMGYNVLLLVDSLSRWAEAVREISVKLEEVPTEEGYPAYTSSRISNFLNRAGNVETLNGEKGSITMMVAISPPGGDLSDPIVQAAFKTTKTAWVLDAELAYRRRFPSLSWEHSFSLVSDIADEWINKNVNANWSTLKGRILEIIKEAREIERISELIGVGVLSRRDVFLLKFYNLFKDIYLYQNAFDKKDYFCSLKKQSILLEAFILLYDKGTKLVEEEREIDTILNEKIVNAIISLKECNDEKIEEKFKLVQREIAELR